MPVIINEFEIITVAPEPTDQPPDSEARPAPAITLRPEDVERIVRHQRARIARVRAD